jgi:hypothetical protein
LLAFGKDREEEGTSFKAPGTRDKRQIIVYKVQRIRDKVQGVNYKEQVINLQFAIINIQ